MNADVAKPREESDAVPVLARRSPEEVVAYLRSVGDTALADALESAARDAPAEPATFGVRRWLFGDRQPPPWLHAAHAFGYLPLVTPDEKPIPIRYAGNIVPDGSLRGSRINIKLDRLCVRSYPGGGTHRVLLDFNARNQVPGRAEDLHFNATFRVPEGEQAGVVGHPIFLGLNVGAEGVAFRCQTVNVKNDQDEAFLGFLESDAFRTGLQLATTAQPALGPLSHMVLGITKSISRRHRNVPVQEFYLGLDFGSTATGARLAEGSYIAVQIPESLQTVWAWDDWVYLPSRGQMVRRDNTTATIPYNHLVFSVSRFTK
ncbi:hypothetical protein R5W24_005132 [Gemmata sp. JC717]|uniref:hypothetical protein n=1 Tax=Gemmata algarum TaxID=2975278 RepID=UPI0021BB9F46|nr:hypothetical protein [Gemmata algarum]MDY3555985.1 hypothetical protein [Gemmata algarum]